MWGGVCEASHRGEVVREVVSDGLEHLPLVNVRAGESDLQYDEPVHLGGHMRLGPILHGALSVLRSAHARFLPL